MSRTLYIIRHGNTFAPGDVVRRIGRRTDLPLVTSGIAQAKALADYFISKNIEPSKIYCAPLQRTMQTAQTIASAQTKVIEIAELSSLIEIDYGPDEGKAEQEVIERIGKAALSAWDERSIPPEKWHVDPTELTNVWKQFFIQIAKEEPPNTSIFAVTSNGISRFALYAADSGANNFPNKLRTGAFGKIIIDQQGKGSVVQYDKRP